MGRKVVLQMGEKIMNKATGEALTDWQIVPTSLYGLYAETGSAPPAESVGARTTP